MHDHDARQLEAGQYTSRGVTTPANEELGARARLGVDLGRPEVMKSRQDIHEVLLGSKPTEPVPDVADICV